MFGVISGRVNNVANDQRHDLMAVTPYDFDWRRDVRFRRGAIGDKRGASCG
jgi:hypothetical protein